MDAITAARLGDFHGAIYRDTTTIARLYPIWKDHQEQINPLHRDIDHYLFQLYRTSDEEPIDHEIEEYAIRKTLDEYPALWRPDKYFSGDLRYFIMAQPSSPVPFVLRLHHPSLMLRVIYTSDQDMLSNCMRVNESLSRYGSNIVEISWEQYPYRHLLTTIQVLAPMSRTTPEETLGAITLAFADDTRSQCHFRMKPYILGDSDLFTIRMVPSE